ncbi:unnamed protein product [Cyprideis torosa]|uniref:Uncharacterized protein n=1 Tax=Cyprideis torosa TaxID=163714 RepID=A0A7R8WC12_9CRUS|nr:unnamed protein product [Cyprideis torosa]CAG0892896.1 unnamed protein product [Cyprideis torosa]
MEWKHDIERLWSVVEHKFRRWDKLDGAVVRGRFGLALTTLGDINLDGYQGRGSLSGGWLELTTLIRRSPERSLLLPEERKIRLENIFRACVAQSEEGPRC